MSGGEPGGDGTRFSSPRRGRKERRTISPVFASETCRQCATEYKRLVRRTRAHPPRVSEGDNMRSKIIAFTLCGAFALLGCEKNEAKPAEPAASASGAAAATPAPAKADTSGPIKVGILHSLSGTMAISETSLKDVALMAID